MEVRFFVMGSLVFFKKHLMETEQETFGSWLLRKRKAAGLSLQELADRADLSKGYISNLERNAPHSVSKATPKPSQDTVDRIAAAVGAPVAEARYVAGYAAPQAQVDQNLSRLLFYFNDLQGEQKADALAVIEALWRRQQSKQKAEKLAHKQRRPA